MYLYIYHLIVIVTDESVWVSLLEIQDTLKVYEVNFVWKQTGQ